MSYPTGTLELLDSGGSSVAGAWWFLIGRPPTDAFLVVRDFDAASKQEREWSCYEFFPGSPWEALPRAARTDSQPLLDFVAGHAPGGTLEWNDHGKARDLFWAFRERFAHKDVPRDAL